MKTLRASNGPFTERPFYKHEEIESISLYELHASGLLPSVPQPIRVDRFLEKRFGVTPQYEDLAQGLLGVTVFGEKGVETIIIARALDDEGTKVAERRIRSTMAHEAGHGLLHAHLFGPREKTQPLFGDFSDPHRPKILCRNDAIQGYDPRPAYDGRWWEFQANSIMGCLLLPRPLVEKALETFLVVRGSLGDRMIDNARRPKAIRHVSELFDTNPVVAKLRIDGMFPADNEAQLAL